MNSFYFPRKPDEIVNLKREFADVTKLQQNLETPIEISSMGDSFNIKIEDNKASPSDARISPVNARSPNLNSEITINSAESSLNLPISCITTVSQTEIPIDFGSEDNIAESPVKLEKPDVSVNVVESIPMEDEVEIESNLGTNEISPLDRIISSLDENPLMSNLPALVSPTTPTVPKERKRRIIIDDDDESPTFNPQRSNKKIRGKNRRNKHSAFLRKQKKTQLLSAISFSDKVNESAVFTSPEMIVSGPN